MRDKLICTGSKIDVLMNYWEKMVFQIMQNSAPCTAKGRPMDQEGQQFAMELHRVPLEIRRACLSAYVARCRRIHSVCFLQWRKMYPGALRFEEEQLDVLLENTIADLNATIDHH